MKSPIRFVAALSIAAALIGCQSNKHPANAEENPTISPMGQPESPPPAPENVQPVTPQTESQPAPEPEHHQRHTVAEHGRAPKLDSLNAIYNEHAGTLTVIVPGRILFAEGSANLKSESHHTLEHIAEAIRHEYPGHRVYVDGHTDTTPIHSSKWTNNHALAAARALSVADYLMKHGISEHDIVVRAYGAINPKRTKEASRRVEIVVVVR
ncbi:MAG TPA: OmpA family protein [Tepidisphaeraceae bacterium]|nr:OmpA family protein [Tepidisphaeraceae bacterium]